MHSTAARVFSRSDEKLLSAQTLRELTTLLPTIYAETELTRLPAVIASALAQLLRGEAHGVLVRDYASGKRTWHLQSTAAEFASPGPGFFAGFRECDPESRQRAEAGDALALVNLVT